MTAVGVPLAIPPSQPIKVQIGKTAPPGGLSAKLRGKGELVLDEDLITLSGRVVYGYPGLMALAATVVSGALAQSVGRVTGFAVAPGLLIWLIIFDLVMKKSVHVTVEPRSGHAVFFRKKRIACLQLPNATWVAVRARKRETAMFLERLKAAYQGRVIVL